jgi:hypothetical protein
VIVLCTTQIRMAKWLRNMFASDAAKAEDAMTDAKRQVMDTEHTIQRELADLQSEYANQQGLLHGLIQARAKKSAVAARTKQLRTIEKQIDQKKKLMINMQRERKQLDSVATNTGVAVAMKASVDAQKKLVQVSCDGDCLDELLDDVDEHRQETSDLAERLGSMGGDDDDIGEDAFVQASDVIAALGISAQDDFLIDEIHAAMHCHTNNQITSINVESPQAITRPVLRNTSSEFDATEFYLPSVPVGQATQEALPRGTISSQPFRHF